MLTRDTVGHLECDRIVGKRYKPHKIVVLIDRALRYVRLGWVNDGTAAGVAAHIARWQNDATGISMLSLTTDQGYEFSALPKLLPDGLYACDAGKPYQKGAVENMNKLNRQYIPKGKSLGHITQAKLNWIANELNHRIRKRLGWLSPAALLSQGTAAATSRTPAFLIGGKVPLMLVITGNAPTLRRNFQARFFLAFGEARRLGHTGFFSRRELGGVGFFGVMTIHHQYLADMLHRCQ